MLGKIIFKCKTEDAERGRTSTFKIGGDFNAHVGRDLPYDGYHIGPESMRKKTTRGGKALATWLNNSDFAC
eukprot:5213968-Heterocapsa_arctica.AAC.1